MGLPSTEEHRLAAVERASRVLTSQDLRTARDHGWIKGGESAAGNFTVPDELIQPASIDLRLGEVAWPLRCSFLPDSESSVEEKLRDLSPNDVFGEVPLSSGAVLERDRPYLVPLIEELHLPENVRAKANPKSSTGRLDVFTRVITDKNHRFDEVRHGYRGKLYLEVVPRSFAIKVTAGLSLNQLRLVQGDARLSDTEIYELHDEFPLLYEGKHPLKASQLSVSNGLFLSLDLEAGVEGERVVGYRAKKNSHPIDLGSRGNRAADYWEPVHAEEGNRIVLEPEIFYLLISAERVCIPPEYAAEMMAYDPTAGELRTHYAGFFDPGFGWDPAGHRFGSRAALEVRARDVPFMIEHRQPVCKLAFEHTREEPDVLYGSELGSNYQGQETMLSKHFGDQTAGLQQMQLNARTAAA